MHIHVGWACVRAGAQMITELDGTRGEERREGERDSMYLEKL